MYVGGLQIISMELVCRALMEQATDPKSTRKIMFPIHSFYIYNIPHEQCTLEIEIRPPARNTFDIKYLKAFKDLAVTELTLTDSRIQTVEHINEYFPGAFAIALEDCDLRWPRHLEPFSLLVDLQILNLSGSNLKRISSKGNHPLLHTRLKILDLRGCKNLLSVRKGIPESVEDLRLDGCEKLKYHQHMIDGPKNLKYLLLPRHIVNAGALWQHRDTWNGMRLTLHTEHPWHDDWPANAFIIIAQDD